MSWDAYLHDDRDHLEGAWDYTHNTNGMIAEAIEAGGGEHVEQCGGPLGPAIGPAWWKRLDGMTGPAGAEFLHSIILGLEKDPPTYRAMNPPNGWGDYDQLLGVLREMRDAVPEWPCTWTTSG